MQAEAAVGRPIGVGRSPGTVVARITARKAIRSGVLWGYIFGAVVASSAWSYTTIYKTQTERHRLAAAFGANKAVAALFGPAPDLQTVAGFTVFKTSLTLMILGAVWGLLTSTRLLRGEEDAGRWDLLLSGQTTRAGAAGQAFAGMIAGAFTIWAITALLTTVVGLTSRVRIGAAPALFFALALVSTPVMFLAVGTFTSQLAATRRQAASYAAAVLGVSYALRMIADSGIGFHWLIWASPLGWVEQLRPLTSPKPLALLPIAAFTGVVGAAGVRLAGRRDLGTGTLPDRSSGRPHSRLLFGTAGLAMRTLRPTVISWWAAIGLTALLTGLVAKAAGGTIVGSSVQEVFSRLGAPGSGPKAYLGVAFLILGVLVAFVAAGHVTAARAEESSGRLEDLVVRPVSRWRWLGGRLVVAVVALVSSGLLAGFFSWLGTAAQHTGTSFATVMGAGLNIVPPAIFVLGVGVLVLGLWPRAIAVVVYGLLGWSLLVELIGGIGAVSHWILDTSVFHQMSSAPATPPDWVTNGAILGIGLACALAGAVRFSHRDLQGE